MKPRQSLHRNRVLSHVPTAHVMNSFANNCAVYKGPAETQSNCFHGHCTLAERLVCHFHRVPKTHALGHSSCRLILSTHVTAVLVKHKRVVGIISINKQTLAIRSTYITFHRHSMGNELACMCASAPFPQHGKYPHVTKVCRTNR